MSTRPSSNFLALVVAAVLVSAHTVHAQRQVSRYEPRRATISPYNNLTRFNGGGLPNYFALVRPQLDQQGVNQRSATALTRQQTSLRTLRQDLDSTQRAIERGPSTISPTGKRSWFMQQGRSSVFRDNTHFYQPFQRTRR